MNKIESAVQHIEKIHKGIYSVTFNKSLLSGKKSLLRIKLKHIESLEKEIKQEKKGLALLRAEIRAYERITAVTEGLP